MGSTVRKINQWKNVPFCNPLEMIVESLEQGIIVADAQGKLFFWNEMIEKNFLPQKKEKQSSVEKTEDTESYTLQQIFPNFWEEFRQQIWGEILQKDVIENGTSRKFARFPIKTYDQKIRYFDLKGIPLSDCKNKNWGIILTFNDVTENIFLENQLLRQAKTTSLANLGSSIAHEIRNPLNSISLNIQLIKEWLQTPQESSQEEIMTTLDNIIAEIRRLDDLIRHFLRFSRPPEPQFTWGNLNDVVKQSLRLLIEPAKKNKVEIVTTFQQLPQILMDSNQLSQAIYNICLNGIQALHEQGGGKLEVSTLNHNDFIIVEIKDNGLGLSQAAQANLFNLFFTTKQDGSGLGLPIANQIVERHDGRIVAENNLDCGACFTIYLPTRQHTSLENK